jgi:hypothetical protein
MHSKYFGVYSVHNEAFILKFALGWILTQGGVGKLLYFLITLKIEVVSKCKVIPSL